MKIPKHGDSDYYDFYKKMSKRIVKLLGKEYVVCGFDPGFAVVRYSPPNDLGIRNSYTIDIPLDVALALPD